MMILFITSTMFKRHPRLKYYVSDRGIIMKIRGCGEKKLFKSKFGYLVFSLHGKLYSGHRVVFETFKGEIPEGLQINHINGIKSDNRLVNLEVVTAKENIEHAFSTGLKKPKFAEDNGQAKLTNEQYYSLISEIVDGKSNKKIAEKYGLHSRYVSLIRGKKRIQSIWEEYEAKNGFRVVPQSGDNSKLTLKQRLLLLEETKTMTNKAIAEKYGLNPSTVSHIKKRRMWKNVWKIKDSEGSKTS